jgi:hypothetical protein
MKAMISRVFSRIGSAAGATNSIVSSGLCTGDIESYYANIVVECLRRMLVPRDSIDVRIKRLGKGPDGLAGFAGYVRILKWDPVVMPLLLQNLPVIDARVRKVVKDSAILEGTHYAGLWFQAGSSVEGAPKVLIGVPVQPTHQTAA